MNNTKKNDCLRNIYYLCKNNYRITIMTEKEKMLKGMTYQATDKQLILELNQTKDLIWKYNNIQPTKLDERKAMIKEILGACHDDVFVNQPFYCDYGKHIRVGKRFFANFNFTVLDEALVTIGDDCFVGPNVSIYTACHSTDPLERNTRKEWAKPVNIGDNVWIGDRVTILKGSSIGKNSVVAACSVVAGVFPDNVVIGGVPAKVIRNI